MSEFINEQQTPQGTTQTVYINQQASNSNGLGVAGFVIALVAFFLCWVPVLGWILWVLGLVLSFVGVFKKPKGLAIAGLVVSFIGLIALLVFVTIIAAAFAI